MSSRPSGSAVVAEPGPTSGSTGRTRSGSRLTDAVPSATSATILSAVHSPLSRATARPRGGRGRGPRRGRPDRAAACAGPGARPPTTTAASSSSRRVVADERDRAAVASRCPRTPRGAVASVARSTPGRLAVPDAEHAVVAVVGLRGGELRAHHRGRRVLLVHRGAAHDRQIRREAAPPGDGDVEAAERRARIARDEGGGVQARAAVGAQLLDREAGQGLDAAQEHRAVSAVT